jgi:hypothetical protein
LEDPKRRSPGRSRRPLEVNIKIDVREIVCEGINSFIWLRIETGGGLL